MVSALASYLDARANHGIWLLRIEDIDPPREADGASELIVTALAAHGLNWDGSILWQSARREIHDRALNSLLRNGDAFCCDCSRRDLEHLGARYSGKCRDRTDLGRDGDCAIRLNTDTESVTFVDLIQGRKQYALAELGGDFVIRRRDRLIAYQLATAFDDSLDGITTVVRGNDLIDSTPRQILVQKKLGLRVPQYAHIPVLVNGDDQKLSKQTHAPAIDSNAAPANLLLALKLLGQHQPRAEQACDCATILDWAVRHWRLDQVPRRAILPAPPGHC